MVGHSLREWLNVGHSLREWLNVGHSLREWPLTRIAGDVAGHPLNQGHSRSE
jgi:hypothetical protein